MNKFSVHENLHIIIIKGIICNRRYVCVCVSVCVCVCVCIYFELK